MSSRALRKLQREQEEQKQLQSLSTTNDSDVSDGNSPVAPKTKLNAFDMLDGVEANDDEEPDAVEQDDEDTVNGEDDRKPTLIAPEPSKIKPKPKKKKNKQKKKRAEKDASAQGTPSGKGKTPEKDEVDEIDRALQDLATRQPTQPSNEKDSVQNTDFSEWEIRVSRLLAAEQKNLNPLNEMKSLFGNLAIEQENNPIDRRNPRAGEVVDLGTALLGRYSYASKGVELGALSAARNCFLQGKPEWPRATSGGLSMITKSPKDGLIRRYDFIRNAAYQDVQAQFQLCVESMQPERMIQLLQNNPYHISTLLQVSEIAKHQGDHSISTDLLERVLYTLGRSVHSTFSAALREGHTRIGFDVAANREIYLTIWRYIASLEMRGTWRTAFEWCKVLLSFDILSDPYGVTHFIDQLALRGRQHQQFIHMCDEAAFKDTWGHLPNISISLSLAHQRNSSPRLARQTLAVATKKYPYIICRLLSEFDIDPPKSIWGSQPETEAEKLYTELYATRAKDLWNTPETTSLLVEVAETLDHYDTSAASDVPKLDISLEDARHVMLTEKPSLIALLPRRYTNLATSSSDPLPPPDDATRGEYTERAPGASSAPRADGGGFFRLPSNLGGANWLGSVLEIFRGGPATTTPNNEEADAEEDTGDWLTGADREELHVLRGFDAQMRNEILENVPEDFREEILDNLARINGNPVANVDSDGEAQLGEIEDDVPATTSASPSASAAAAAEASSAAPPTDYWTDTAADLTTTAIVESPPPSFPPPPPPPPPGTSPPPSPPQPQPESSSSSSSLDPQRTQRYLLSTGLTSLQEWIGEHGANVDSWAEQDRNPQPLDDFVRRLQELRPKEREWVVRVCGQRDRAVGKVLGERLGR